MTLTVNAPDKVRNKAEYQILALFFVLSIGVSIVISAFIQPPLSRDDMPGGSYRSGGIFNPRPTVYGLLDPQTAPDGTTYQWSTSHATLTFPYIANFGRYADVALRLSSNRPPGQPLATVKISLNGHSYPPVQVPNGYQVLSYSLDTQQFPNPYLDPAHVQLDIESSTFSQATGKDLGVAIDWIQLQPHRSGFEVVLSILAWVATLSIIMLVGLSRLGRRWAPVYGLAALLSFCAINLTYSARVIPPYVEIWLAGLAWIVAVWLAPARRPAWGFALVGIFLWVVLAGRVLSDWQVDDAYISYRYAWNLVHGSGLVYNPGEAVEGYTNFLWTLVAAAAIWLGIDPAAAMLALTLALSIGLLALTCIIGVKLAARLSGDTAVQLWALVPVGVLAIDTSFLTYGAKGSGLESVPFAFLVLLAAALIWWAGHDQDLPDRRLILGGVVLALAALTRPEGLAVAAIFIGVKAWFEWRRRDGRTRSVVALLTVPFLLIVIPYEIWRVSFYGYPFPNTFYAKTGSSLAFIQRGWEYTWEFIGDHWFPVLLVVLGAAGLIVSAGRRLVRRNAAGYATGTPDAMQELLVALSVTVFLYSLYIIEVGGDHFPAGRFFVPLLAPLVLLSTQTARSGLALFTSRNLRLTASAALAVGLMAYCFSSLSLQDPNGPLARRTDRDTNYVNIWGSFGLWLRDHTPPQTLAASPVAGAIAYYSQRNVVDMLGITDLHIGHAYIPTMGSGLAGHEKQDPPYVLQRAPQYIMPYPNYFDSIENTFSSEYMTTTVRGPLGPDITWWERRNAPR